LFTPATIIVDEPTDFIDKWTGEPYSPGNYDQRYKGAVTVRKGLEESRNILTVKLLQSISAQKGVEFCRKFGIASPVYPYLSLALGAPSVRVIELVSAYTVFPNQGVRVKPYFLKRIEDKEGNILEENTVETEEVVSPQVAYVMTSLLQGVVNRGTAWSVRSYASLQDWPLGGKTGTTDKYTDAWFVGFSPSLCAGVWVGNKTAVSIGERKSGAVAALPAWRLFFSRVVRDKKRLMEENGKKDLAVEEFEIPQNLSFVEIDRKTGLIATPICLFALREVFLPGTEPDRFCSHEDHMRILNYYGVKKK
jgi:penicillin-binding protein 1A